MAYQMYWLKIRWGFLYWSRGGCVCVLLGTRSWIESRLGDGTLSFFGGGKCVKVVEGVGCLPPRSRDDLPPPTLSAWLSSKHKIEKIRHMEREIKNVSKHTHPVTHNQMWAFPPKTNSFCLQKMFVSFLSYGWQSIQNLYQTNYIICIIELTASLFDIYFIILQIKIVYLENKLALQTSTIYLGCRGLRSSSFSRAP